MRRISLASVLVIAAAPSRCTVATGAVGDTVSCPHNQLTLWTGMFGLTPRGVHYMTPAGTPPTGGWPLAIVWSPSFWGANVMWFGAKAYPAGAYYDTMELKALLDAGYAVITPESHLEGFTFWDTNNPLTPIWDLAPDKYFTDSILSAARAGRFGPINSSRLFTTGMSSGGYMASRMAVSYPGTFKAVAVQSGSYATCAGPICFPPASFSHSHAPTLFIHGSSDLIVPIATMYTYRDRLNASGVTTSTIVHPGGNHEFFPESPDAIVNWFRTYDPGH